MGTTIVAALTKGTIISFVSAGDSRAYRLRDGEFCQLTVDDSWVQAAVDEGVLMPEEAESHPMKNIITKAIGAKEDIDIAVEEHSLQSNDLYLLCSDGLHGMISEKRLAEMVVTAGASLEELVTALIATANENGGKDNVTAVAIRYKEE